MYQKQTTMLQLKQTPPAPAKLTLDGKEYIYSPTLSHGFYSSLRGSHHLKPTGTLVYGYDERGIRIYNKI